MSTLATVEPTNGKAPVLTTGDLMPAVAMDFENTAQDFFVAKSVPAEEQVSLILPGIKDIQICDWITVDHARISSLPFNKFIKELHLNFFQNNWEDQICNEILTSTLMMSSKRKSNTVNVPQNLQEQNTNRNPVPRVFINYSEGQNHSNVL